LKLQKKEEKKKLKLDPNLKEKRSNFQLNSTSLTDFLNQAQNKQNAFSKFSDVNPFDSVDNLKTNDRDKETSLKAFYKEFRKVVEASDVIIEVLDARDPLGTRCPQVEEMILSSGSNKKLVLLLNKIGIYFITITILKKSK
jgi:nuclear GTP-binding protein